MYRGLVRQVPRKKRVDVQHPAQGATFRFRTAYGLSGAHSLRELSQNLAGGSIDNSTECTNDNGKTWITAGELVAPQGATRPRRNEPLETFSEELSDDMKDDISAMQQNAERIVPARRELRNLPKSTPDNRFTEAYRIRQKQKGYSTHWKVEDFFGVTLGKGRYQIRRRLGVGSMAYVLLARDTRLDADVVIKIPKLQKVDSDEIHRRFLTESQLLIRLNHPNVVSVLDVGEFGRVPYLVMEMLPGGTLLDRLKANGGKKRRLRPEQLKKWLREVASALDYCAEQGTVHRDVKPANILFDLSGNGYLADFGLTKIMHGEHTKLSSSATRDGTVLGTPNYIAPEVILGEPFDRRADQYSLGITVYHALIGRPPMQGSSPTGTMINQTVHRLKLISDVCPDVPKESALAIRRCIEKVPEKRFATCEEFAEAVIDGLRDSSMSLRTMEAAEIHAASEVQSRPNAMGETVNHSKKPDTEPVSLSDAEYPPPPGRPRAAARREIVPATSALEKRNPIESAVAVSGMSRNGFFFGIALVVTLSVVAFMFATSSSTAEQGTSVAEMPTVPELSVVASDSVTLNTPAMNHATAETVADKDLIILDTTLESLPDEARDQVSDLITQAWDGTCRAELTDSAVLSVMPWSTNWWGCGLEIPSANGAKDLSGYISGTLRFEIKSDTTSPFKLGFQTGRYGTQSRTNNYVVFNRGAEFRTMGQWQSYSVTVADLISHSGLTDLTAVTVPFYIRCDECNDKEPIEVRNVFYTPVAQTKTTRLLVLNATPDESYVGDTRQPVTDLIPKAWDGTCSVEVTEFSGLTVSPWSREWWGCSLEIPSSSNAKENLSDFADGTLNFEIRSETTASFKLGFHTGNSEGRHHVDVNHGSGLRTSGEWQHCTVRIDELMDGSDRKALSNVNVLFYLWGNDLSDRLPIEVRNIYYSSSPN